MTRTCVVVANRARARFFVVEANGEREGAAPKLREIDELTDAEGALKGNDVFSDSRSGSNRAPGGAHSTYDDHRERHREEVERRFAKRIGLAIASFVRMRATEKLVLAADPHMLGLLRAAPSRNLPPDLELVEFADDLCRQKPEQIRAALARRGAFDQSPASLVSASATFARSG
jgi:protein required for attachment to host cells